MNTDTNGEQGKRKAYNSPKVMELGSIERLTQWVGGPWGEFFGGIDSGYNPWKPNPGDVSS